MSAEYFRSKIILIRDSIDASWLYVSLTSLLLIGTVQFIHTEQTSTEEYLGYKSSCTEANLTPQAGDNFDAANSPPGIHS